MAEDFLYTVFDHDWNPSNELEDFFSKVESAGSQLFQDILVNQSNSESTRVVLARFLSNQPVRHPDMRTVKHRLVSNFLSFLAMSHDLDKVAFVKAFEELGFKDIDNLAPAEAVFDFVTAIPRDTFQTTKAFIEDLQPYDPRLPFSDVILGAWQLAEKLQTMDVIVHEVPTGSTFILGDTPIDQQQLLAGFTVPLSKALAVEFRPTTSTPKMHYQTATATFVDSVQEDQYRMAVFNLVGPDKPLLESLSRKLRS